MINFVDLNTGNVFMGGKPYVFWFDDAQSTDLIYTKPICFISKKPTAEIKLPINSVFKLLNINSHPNPTDPQGNINNYNDEILNNVTYKDIHQLYANEQYFPDEIKIFENVQYIKINGYKYGDVYVYIFYITGSAVLGGQYKEDFKIDDECFSIGADFYALEESYKINLSNFGVEIPDAIQKSIYPSNIHEDKIDNILMNRKWKELLSNYWDVIANKGSYKSLYNSLKWFEYGEELKLYEIWKSGIDCKLPYEERDVKEVLSDKYFETLNGFSKTTYFAISCALEKIVGNIYDEEKNPILEKITRMWSVDDLSLKLSLLGAFFKTYFMPIHTDCIRASIENIVYTNTFKAIAGSAFSRLDTVRNLEEFECNVKDGDVFELGNVSARVGKDTLFGNQYQEKNPYTKEYYNYDNIDIIGVQLEEPMFKLSNDNINDNDIKTYLTQHFNGIGSIIEFRVNINIPSIDFVKREKLSILSDTNEVWFTITDYKLYDCRKTENGYVINISFNLLCTKEKNYDIRLEFETGAGRIFTKRIKFNVIDTNCSSIKVYRIVRNDIIDLNEYDFPNDFVFRSTNHQLDSKKRYIQYIPAIKESPYLDVNKNHKGICLNHYLIIRVNDFNEVLNNDYMNEYYFMWTKGTPAQNYVLCMSKEFGFKPDPIMINKFKNSNGSGIYRNDYIYYPPFHHKEELTGDSIEDFIVTDNDAICIVPEVSFSKYIEDARWEFINRSTIDNKTIIPPYDVKEPYVADYDKKILEPGYYDIVFRYKLRNGQKYNTIVLKSAFLKK